jgi:hypothetical protein
MDQGEMPSTMQDISGATGLRVVERVWHTATHAVAVFACQPTASAPLLTVKVVYLDRCSDMVRPMHGWTQGGAKGDGGNWCMRARGGTYERFERVSYVLHRGRYRA